ncbi:Phosphohistidine phosphatase SixA [Zhongshania aliphaticivorans]|uniref:Phosphohistidine phosphatase SixA n=1 Tax=Zhongshania aliphaticivorans TaxID=1470434 RepID=A0A5S9MXH3_9GAMM|nr:histidine phosphatase family protein [Zhongshania aliphaticivorans]CAA0081432.1 Phosphohistidine phosphatase SixA [Zhongshania aliphaticivorans]CAA0085021.1 Phosphohistidine phosphatase SixA [Zhongshania aliphaticivorans]
MKTLYLLRHAKSDWDDDEISDADRPISKRGKKDCQLIANELQRSEHHFSHVYCSPARRAQDTLKRFQACANVFDSAEIVHESAIYTFEAEELQSWLKELPQSIERALLIGHNPALADLANYLYDGKIGHIGTCTFIELEINIEYWDQLRADSAKLSGIIRPKQFR